ncbi:DUF418 domain-containing protein [Nocardia huaxiensis]|uniref:DUF418 domain-containing protein n=1 Tax=Nocardia huaxiensis TaxID=2755382 RepID=UPI001E3ACF9E|nr:DUF418 domain-containing protein [Nocardia huaxiensis]UFS98228.1 DUF418 domain-containing protein [Nocardia huaxiensis]
MTAIQPPPQETSPPKPGTGPKHAAPAVPSPSTGRLVGIDLARALAVFGMYTVHIGPPLSATSGVGSWVRYLTDGRSSILFATLAGFSLMLIAGRRQPKTGRAGRQAKARIAIRALILIALGTGMAMAYGDVVILAFYGVYFLLAIPLVRLSAKTLALIAAALALVTPQLGFVLRSVLTEPVQRTVDAYDPLEKLSGVGILDLLLTGMYPTLTWMPFVIAGMALARPDLAAGAVQARVAALGAGLTVFGYGLSRLLAGPGALASMAEAEPPASGSGSFGPGGSASSLLVAGPHSGTTFDIIGSLGVAILVIVGATAAMQYLPRLRRLATPLIAVGSMSLTAYVGHFVAQSFVPMPVPGLGEPQRSWLPLLVFVLGAMVFATIWSRFFRRGPLEYLLNAATKPAKYIR